MEEKTEPRNGWLQRRNGRVAREEIAFAAFCLWHEEGCPKGRDLNHWFRAEELLQRLHRLGAAERVDGVHGHGI